MCRYILIIFFYIEAIAFSDSIYFNDVLSKTLTKSNELKYLKLKLEASVFDKQIARAEFYPQIKLETNLNYTKDLIGENSEMSVVGSTVFSDTTQFQNSFTLSANYEIFSFASSINKIYIATKENEKTTKEYERLSRDIKLSLAEIYENLLLADCQLWMLKEELGIKKEIFRIKNRLRQSGSVSSVEIAKSSLSIADTFLALDEYVAKKIGYLMELSAYTGQTYSDNSEVKPFESDKNAESYTFDGLETPDVAKYDVELAKKNAELNILKAEGLPKLSSYGAYSFFGSNKDGIGLGLKNTRAKNLSVGFLLTFPLFDGFKNSAQVEKAKIEQKQILEMREKALIDIKTKHDKLLLELKLKQTDTFLLKAKLAEADSKLGMVEKLRKTDNIDLLSYLDEKIENLKIRFDLKVASIKSASKNVQLAILKGIK